MLICKECQIVYMCICSVDDETFMRVSNVATEYFASQDFPSQEYDVAILWWEPWHGRGEFCWECEGTNRKIAPKVCWFVPLGSESLLMHPLEVTNRWPHIRTTSYNSLINGTQVVIINRGILFGTDGPLSTLNAKNGRVAWPILTARMNQSGCNGKDMVIGCYFQILFHEPKWLHMFLINEVSYCYVVHACSRFVPRKWEERGQEEEERKPVLFPTLLERAQGWGEVERKT